jgi:hypothetical protein
MTPGGSRTNDHPVIVQMSYKEMRSSVRSGRVVDGVVLRKVGTMAFRGVCRTSAFWWLGVQMSSFPYPTLPHHHAILMFSVARHVTLPKRCWRRVYDDSVITHDHTTLLMVLVQPKRCGSEPCKLSTLPGVCFRLCTVLEHPANRM